MISRHKPAHSGRAAPRNPTLLPGECSACRPLAGWGLAGDRATQAAGTRAAGGGVEEEAEVASLVGL
jgi:hypothetical protein